ncbi:endoglucanase [Novosphingobium sp. CF614]|uniref:glycosyl hydrolase family 8 n=1 Tax=Novosphingobium sp. CF614 TaxID=1884364 RepID=UPI0008DF0E0E|nr:glycosyl hydrolase family 8 [Novosphingobium sp. CF614]SFF91931.1 endoglucanase [Novosphingobium sp. CF614]
MADDILGVDRRTFALGMLAALTAACNTGNQGRAQPVEGFWPLWRDRFVTPEGRVIDTGNGNISHSEGQSYGMILALHANDRPTFERIARWTEDTLGREDMALHSWRYDPRDEANPVSDPNNATDGDMVIAWALALAGERWGEAAWAERSVQVRAAIHSQCVLTRYDRALLLPGMAGFVETGQVTLNPSYFVWPALDLFTRLDGAATWSPVIRDCEEIARLARFGGHGLPSDWIVVTGRKDIIPAPGRPPRFGFDAIRIALWGIVGQRTDLTQPIAAWWRQCLAQHKAIPAWVDVVSGEEANYAVSNGGAAIAARLLGTPAPAQLADDYFAAALQMLARL